MSSRASESAAAGRWCQTTMHSLFVVVPRGRVDR
jgi:hypothetical protein